jgi:hypothetical protein
MLTMVRGIAFALYKAERKERLQKMYSRNYYLRNKQRILARNKERRRLARNRKKSLILSSTSPQSESTIIDTPRLKTSGTLTTAPDLPYQDLPEQQHQELPEQQHQGLPEQQHQGLPEQQHQELPEQQHQGLPEQHRELHYPELPTRRLSRHMMYLESSDTESIESQHPRNLAKESFTYREEPIESLFMERNTRSLYNCQLCGDFMGWSNPRQLCGKSYCMNEY